MRLGKSPVTNKTYHGVPNSQVHGTNVIVFTVGNYPMKMVFAYPNPHYDIEQDVSKYLMLESFSIKCGEGHITILDPLDDVLMQHGVMFEDLSLVQVIDTEGRNGNEGETDLRHRIAFVMRWLGNEEEYYMDTSTIRLNEKMKEAMKKSTANNEFDGKGRSAYD